jgi:Kef-type K+ transport system membrane component KefB
MDIGLVLIGLSSAIIVSYLANRLAASIRLPSVLVLLALGAAVQLAAQWSGWTIPDLSDVVSLLGTVGLVLIVLEAALDIRITRSNLVTIVQALATSVLVIGLSTAAFAFLFAQVLGLSLHQALLFAVPLSILSSAIVIPSVGSLAKDKKEFLTLEAAFSDIVGVLAFNFVASQETFHWGMLLTTGAQTLAVAGFAALAAVFLVFLMQSNTSPIRYFLIFGFLILFYGLGKLYHLPVLMVILVFGLVLKNVDRLGSTFLGKYLRFERLEPEIQAFETMNGEVSFIVRTFFFIIFGMVIDFQGMTNPVVLALGGAVLVLQYVVRVVALLPFIRKGIFTQVLTSPRGLVTVLLFYSIPGRESVPILGNVVFVVIAASVVVMTATLLLTKPGEPARSVKD